MPFDDAVKLLQDALANGDVVVAVVAVAMVLGLVVLKLLKKEVPFLDPVLELVIGLVKRLRPAKQPEVKDAGLADVVQIEEARKPEDK